MEPPLPPRKSHVRPPIAVHNPYKAAATGAASPATRRDSSWAAGRGDAGGGGGGENGWEGSDEGRTSDLRQMPSQIAVQDVYPPELSRYNHSFLCGKPTACGVGNVRFVGRGSTLAVRGNNCPSNSFGAGHFTPFRCTAYKSSVSGWKECSADAALTVLESSVGVGIPSHVWPPVEQPAGMFMISGTYT